MAWLPYWNPTFLTWCQVHQHIHTYIHTYSKEVNVDLQLILKTQPSIIVACRAAVKRKIRAIVLVFRNTIHSRWFFSLMPDASRYSPFLYSSRPCRAGSKSPIVTNAKPIQGNTHTVAQQPKSRLASNIELREWEGVPSVALSK